MFTVKLIINFTIMLKNILKLEGAQQLNKTEQRSIQGGGPREQCEILGGNWNCVTNSSTFIMRCECSGMTLPDPPNEK
ncbi:MAG: hypothetical protein ACI9Y7_001923 [Dokdonia sp.]|jgi:hypothetical protein